MTELQFSLRAPQAVVIKILIVILIVLGFTPWMV